MDSDMKQPKRPSRAIAGNAGLLNSSIDKEWIAEYLSTNCLGRRIEYFDELESTNFAAKEFAKIDYPAGTVVLCENQTAGRGRRDKRWIAVPKESICMSIILRPDIHAKFAGRYTVATAIALCEALKDYCIHDARIKWPNDVMVNDKKISGILLDCGTQGDRISYVVIGIGLNVNTHKFFGDISDTATSIYQSTGIPVSRNRVIAKLLDTAEPLFEMCETETGFAEIMRRYVRLSSVLKKQVRITRGDEVVEGEVIGFDDIGRILLRLDDGLLHVFDSGDVTLRFR